MSTLIMYSGAASVFQDTSEFKKLAFTLRNKQLCYTEYILLCRIHCSNTRRRAAQRDVRNRQLWSEHPTEMAMKK